MCFIKTTALAFINFKRAADKGYAKAQYNLALLYYDGVYVDKSYSSAAYWFRLAADLGNPKAQTALGNMYLHGDGVKQNLHLSVYWLRQARSKQEFQAITQLKELGL